MRIRSLVAGLVSAACSSHGIDGSSSRPSIMDLPPTGPDGIAQLEGQPAVGYQWVDPPYLGSSGDNYDLGVLPLPYSTPGDGLYVDPLGGFATVARATLATATPSATPPAAVFVSRFTQEGALSWLRHYECEGEISTTLPALMTDNGRLVVAGSHSGACNFGGLTRQSGPVADAEPESEDAFDSGGGQSAPSHDLFALTIDSSGELRQLHGLSDTGEQRAVAVYSQQESLHLLTEFQEQIEVDGQAYEAPAGADGRDTLHLELDATDGVRVVRQLGAQGIVAAQGTDAGGVVLVGAGPLPKAAFPEASTQPYGWAAVLDPAGEVDWAVHWQPPVAPTSLSVGGRAVYLALVGPKVELGAQAPPDVPAEHVLTLLALREDGELEFRRDVAGEFTRASLALNDDRLAVWGSVRGSVEFIAMDVRSAAAGGSPFLWQLDPSGRDADVVVLGELTGDGLALAAHPAGGWLTSLWVSGTSSAYPLSPGYSVLWFRGR